MRYRVNYGNGQVNYQPSLAACRREISGMELYKKQAFIQRYEAGSADCPGEWVRVEVKKEV